MPADGSIDGQLGSARRPAAVNLDLEVQRESIGIRCRQSVHSLPMMTVLFLIFGALLWREVEQTRLLAWLGSALAATVLRAAVCGWIAPRLDAADAAAIGRFQRLLFATTLVGTLATGAGVWWVAAIGSDFVQMFVTLHVTLYAIGSLINTSTSVPSFVAGVIANLGQPIVFWAMQGWHGAAIALPLAIIAYLLFTFGRANARVFAEAVRMKFRNLDLVRRLYGENRAVEHALAIAEDVSQSKSRFLAAASHDLRQPLHALRLQVGAISLQTSEERVQRSVKQTLEVIESLDELFQNLLDLSRFDAGALRPRLQPCAVEELVTHLDREFRVVAEAKGLRIEVRPLQAWVRSDLILLERLLRNLLSNAVRYTSSGSVGLSARREDGKVVLAVSDTGPGIAWEHRERIFEEFYRGGAEAAGGAGLGLAIVRRIDALLGLGLELVSEPGRGSEFSVRLEETSV